MRLFKRAPPAAQLTSLMPAGTLGEPADSRRDAGALQVIEVGDVRTEVMSWDAAPECSAAAPVFFVMLPGNPGAAEFYAPYMRALAAASRRRTHLVVCGHAAHSARASSPRLYNLRDQVEHKRNFIESLRKQYPGAKFILAGHSVGAYMVVELLRTLPDDAVLRGVLLFPTLCHIGATVNGRTLMPLFRYFRWAARAGVYLASLLPASAQRRVVSWHLAGQTDAAGVEATLSLMDANVVSNALWMALHEMREINALDAAHMARVQDKLVLYFAETDGWVDDGVRDELMRTYTRARHVRCEEGHKHAFVLDPRSSKRMADHTWSWIKDDIAAVDAGRNSRRRSLGGGAAATVAPATSSGTGLGSRASAAAPDSATAGGSSRRRRSSSHSGR